MKYIVITSNGPDSNVHNYGPFDWQDQAVDWAESHVFGTFKVQSLETEEETEEDGPQPDTNVTRVTHLMESGSPLMQCFVIEAIGKYAALCLQKDAKFFDSGFMNGAAWIDCAKRAKAWSDTHYGLTGVERPIAAEQVGK